MILTGWPVNLKQKLSKKVAKNYLTFYAIKKKIIFLCMYKMVDISNGIWNKAGVSVFNNTWKWWCK